MGKLVKSALKNWPIILLFALSLAVRLLKINELFYFTYDESIPAFVGRRLILWHHIPLIGGVTPFNFHLAPYFYWFYALLLYFSKLNPIVWGYAGAAISLLTTYLIFNLASITKSKKFAISAVCVWTFSLLANIYDRHLWALYWGPLFSLLTLYCLLKIISGQRKYIYFLGFVIALSVHADLSNLILPMLTVLVWWVYRLPFKKDMIVASLFIPMLIIPLAIFDLRHNFSNTAPALKFLEQSANTNKPEFSTARFSNNTLIFPQTFTRLVYKFGDNEINKNYSYCKTFVMEKYRAIPTLFILLAAALLIGYIYWSLFKNTNNLHKLVSFLILLYFASIQLYGTILRGDIFEHYLAGLLPIFAFVLAFTISKLPKYIWIIALALFISVNLYKLSLLKNSHGFKYKKEAIAYTNGSVGQSDFSLDSLSTCWRYSGYRYLFAVFAKEPVKSYVDPNFGYLYETTPIAAEHPETVVAFVTHDFSTEQPDFYTRYALLKSHEKESSIFGNIEAIVLDNRSKWFDQSSD